MIRRLADWSLLLGEAILLAMAAALLADAAGGNGPPLFIMPLAIFGGFYLVKLLLRFDVSAMVVIVAAMVLTVAGLLFLGGLAYEGIPLYLGWLRPLLNDPEAFLSTRWPAVWALLLTGAAWLRGAAVAQREITQQRALLSYSVGLPLVVVLLMFGQGSDAAGTINAGALPYFMTGLFTLALVHLSRGDAAAGITLRGPWLVTLGGTVGALAVLSALVGLFPIGAINRALAPLGLLLLRLMDLVILVIAFPFAVLITWLLRLITGGRPLEWPQLNRIATEGAEQVNRNAERGGPAAILVFLGKAIFLLAVLAVIGAVLWWAYRRLRRPARAQDDDEQREALREGGLGADLGALANALLGRFRRGPGEQEPDLPDGILRVRRLYLRALRRAEDAGRPRPAAATPHEFAPVLTETLARPSAATLSDRFAAARYGRQDPTRQELSALERDL